MLSNRYNELGGCELESVIQFHNISGGPIDMMDATGDDREVADKLEDLLTQENKQRINLSFKSGPTIVSEQAETNKIV